MTDEELFSAALSNLLGDLFTGILYSNKMRMGEVGQKELLEAAAGTLWFFLNDDGRQVLRGVLDRLLDKPNEEPEGLPRGLVN